MTVEMTATLSRAARSSVVKFFVVGMLSFVADAASLFVLHGLLRIWLPAATALAFAAAFVVNFGLNKLWAFRAAGRTGRQLSRYVCLVLANLIVTVALVQGLTWLGLPYLLSKVCTTALIFLANYVISRRWIFVSTVGS
jgi:putative flippase GtrA